MSIHAPAPGHDECETGGKDGPAADRTAFKPQDAATSFPLGLLCKRRCALSCITGNPGKPSSGAPIHSYARLSEKGTISTCVSTCAGAYLANILDAGKNCSDSSGLGRCGIVHSSSALKSRVPHILAGGLPWPQCACAVQCGTVNQGTPHMHAARSSFWPP